VPLRDGYNTQIHSRIARGIVYDRSKCATTFAKGDRMTIDTLLNLLQAVAAIGVLLTAFQIRDRLDKLNQQIEKK
jgi:hypothetical protein